MLAPRACRGHPVSSLVHVVRINQRSRRLAGLDLLPEHAALGADVFEEHRVEPLIIFAPENPHRLPALVHAGTCGRRCGPALGQELSCGGVTQVTPRFAAIYAFKEWCELCWVLRNECDYCSASRPRIGCFSPAARAYSGCRSSIRFLASDN